MTRIERLQRIVEKIAPKQAAVYADGQAWQTLREGPNGRHLTAPYLISTLPEDRRRVQVTSDDGDVIAGTGATMDEALSALETKVGVA